MPEVLAWADRAVLAANAAGFYPASGTSKLIGDWLLVRMCGGGASRVLAVVATFRGDCILSVPGTPGRRREQLVARRSGVRWSGVLGRVARGRFDHVRDGVGVGDHRQVRCVDLRYRGVCAGGHELLGLGRDGVVSCSDHVPAGDGGPGRRA